MNYSYVTLLTSDNYVQGVILLKECLRKVKSIYPLLVLITNDLSEKTLEVLKLANINTKLVDSITTPENIYELNKKCSAQHAEIWKNTFTKFRIWQLKEYDKLIFLDADLLILKNLDHCFEMPEWTAARDGEYFNIWEKDYHFNSGFMVIKPNEDIYNDLINFVNTLDPDKMVNYAGQQRVIADQDVLNEYKKNWPEHEELHLSKYYNVFAPYVLRENETDLMENCYFIHFVGVKPWQFNDDKPLILRTELRNLKSFLMYELAFSIILLAYIKEFKDFDYDKNINDFYGVVSQVAHNTFEDDRIATDYARRCNFADLKAISMNAENTKLKKEALSDILYYLYINKIVNGAYIFETLSQVEQNSESTTNFWFDKILDVFTNYFKNL